MFSRIARASCVLYPAHAIRVVTGSVPSSCGVQTGLENASCGPNAWPLTLYRDRGCCVHQVCVLRRSSTVPRFSFFIPDFADVFGGFRQPFGLRRRDAGTVFVGTTGTELLAR